MSLSSETWSQTSRINTHRHTPKLLYFSDIALNCLVCNISTEKLLKTKTTSLNNKRTLFLVFTLPFVQLKTHNRLFIVIKTFKEGGVGEKAFIVLIISIIILQQYCFLPWNITEQTEDEWKWEQSSRGRQEKEGASGASTALFCQRQSHFYFTLWDQQYTLYLLQSDSQKCFASCVENWSTRSPLSHKSPLSDKWATEQNYLY